MSEVATPTPPAAPRPIVTPAPKGRSLWDDARRRLVRNPAAMTSLTTLIVLALIAIIGPMVWVHSIETISEEQVGVGPTLTNMHWLGTDTEGRDLMARLMFGLRISMLIGICATFVAVLIGVTYGAVAGFVGGVADEVMMRVVDVLYSVPFIFLVIVLMTVIQTPDPMVKLLVIFAALGAVEWLTMARVVRGQAIALRRREFVEAARAAGASPLAIVFRHIVPNVLGPVVVLATLNVPAIILAESFLSFVGLGVQEPLTSLGRLISDGASHMEEAPWLLISPAITMVVLLMALNFLGDGLRDALDPKDR